MERQTQNGRRTANHVVLARPRRLSNYHIFGRDRVPGRLSGCARSAMFINSIEVSALVFVKCFNLYTWADTWKEQDGKAKLKRVQKQFAAVMGAVRTRIVAVSAMMRTKKSSDSEPQGVDEEQLSSANDNPGKV